MSRLDINALLVPISEELPCGSNLELDPNNTAFRDLQRDVQGKQEQQIGDNILPAQPPNWQNVKQQAVDLFAQCKHLWAAVWLTRALIQTNGLHGLGEGLLLTAGLIRDHWQHLHPQLDPDDNLDPMERLNILSTLAHPMTTLAEIQDIPLVNSRGMGVFGFRDIQLSRGKAKPTKNETVIDWSNIEAAFLDVELESVLDQRKAVQEAAGALSQLEEQISDKAGQDAISLKGLGDLLKDIDAVLTEQLEKRGAVSADAQNNGDENVENSQPVQGGPVNLTAVNSREDVIRVLDLACAYFARHEPSSPVPLLLKRAKRLMAKDFMDILRDLVPEAVSKAELIGGDPAKD